jgi:hypothetical protein
MTGIRSVADRLIAREIKNNNFMLEEINIILNEFYKKIKQDTLQLPLTGSSLTEADSKDFSM